MKYVVCDITGRTLNYDKALCEAINEEVDGDEVELWSPQIIKPTIKLRSFISFVPNKYRNRSGIVFRLLKVVDTLLAYMSILYRVFIFKPEVFHLQWFPFLSLGTRGAGIDLFFLRMIKYLSPNTLFVFTIHNICPHSMKESEIASYNPVFIRGLKIFDHFVVHTKKTKEEIVGEMEIESGKISVVHHGIFVPKDFHFTPLSYSKEQLNIIMYGNQNWYKGTDILVESLKYLDERTIRKCKITICGAISKDYLAELKEKDSGSFINWIPNFVEDNILYDNINKSDLIVLPYRRISQSGVLLLALSTNRLIATSDLPTFKETLDGFDDELFFKSEDAKDLARLLELYVNQKVDIASIQNSIKSLNQQYSWSNSAKDTLLMYKKQIDAKNSRRL